MSKKKKKINLQIKTLQNVAKKRFYDIIRVNFDNERGKIVNNKISTGNSGEYFVAGELERRGFTVAIPMSNVKDFDILAINRTTYKQYAIQVKTTRLRARKWTLNKKNEDLIGENIIYILVALNELDNPEYHIVPSKIIANTKKKSHREWLDKPGIHGQPHNDTNRRDFFDNENKYLNNWKILDIE